MVESKKRLADEASAFKKGLKQIEHETMEDLSKIEKDSEYEWDFDDDQKEERKKQELKKGLQDIKDVRDYENQKAKGTLKVTFDEHNEVGTVDGQSKWAPDQALDDLWQRVRYFLNDLNDKGEKKELLPKQKSNRLKFLEACEQVDMEKRGILPNFAIERAFNSSRFVPLPSKTDFAKLFKALEVYNGEDQEEVSYQKLLEAPIRREANSINGIFPIIKAKGPTQKQLDEKKRIEDEEKKKKEILDKEEKKRQELTEKRLEQMKKSGPDAFKKLSKQEQNMKQREDQLKKEEEERELNKQIQEEQEKVRKEVIDYIKSIESLRSLIKKSGETLRNWFNLFDDNKDGHMELPEFKALLKQVGVACRDSDLTKVFELMDLQQSGRISYNDFCNVIEKNETLPIKDIVAKRRRERGELNLDEKEGDSTKNQQQKSHFGDIQSTLMPESRGIGSVQGLSDIMGQSQFDEQDKRLFNEDDILDNYNDIKEMFRENAFTFDELLVKMGKPDFQKESIVTINDFERLIRSLPGGHKFSNQQVKQVFNNYATSGATASDSYIPLHSFKDYFYPGMHWQKQMISDTSSNITFDERSNISSVLQSHSESINISAQLAGKKYDDVVRDKEAEQERIQMERDARYSKKQANKVNFAGLDVIREERHDESQSEISMNPFDNFPAQNVVDPKKHKNQPATQSRKGNESSMQSDFGKTINKQDLQRLGDPLFGYKNNKDYYLQNEASSKQIPLEEKFAFDKSLDLFFKKFCKTLLKELEDSQAIKRSPASYVDQYGRDTKGYINFAEFRQIYEIHVQSVADNDITVANVEEAKLRALFVLFDIYSTGRISAQDFEKIVLTQQPGSSIIERFRNKLKKGGERLMRVLTEEFQEIDIPYGCVGTIPISNFQTIMIDYDLPPVDFDLIELRKKGIIIMDNQGHEFVKYQSLLDEVKPKKLANADIATLEKLVTKVQAVWRGYAGRKYCAKVRQSEFKQIGSYAGILKGGDRKVSFKDGGFDMQEVKGGKGATGKKLTPQEKKFEAEKKKKDLQKSQREKLKKGQTAQAKMDLAVRPAKDLKHAEQQKKFRLELEQYIKTVILDAIVTSAQCYGESLDIGRDIQKNFESRPVTKFVFPLIQEFQYNVVGVMPKSLQTLNELGQIMFLDSENLLNQYDIPTNKTLQQVNLGTRPPLKHYEIIDMVCDQTSARIYILNSNWILEIWNIEQNASLPQKRLAVCTNEGNKDYISLYYKNNFNGSKPRFLSLSDHNQQILVVNTSCVDGSIVFIDPISFSVLKKIQLRYQDYEIPKQVRHAITHLKRIFQEIIQKTNKNAIDIFADITDQHAETVKIRDFVQRLTILDSTLKADELFNLCTILDKDNNGKISLDEFLHYFQHLEEEETNEFEKRKQEEDLVENIWPEWIVQANQLEYAKTLIGKMYDLLEKKHGISPEQAFGIYDSKDRGMSSVDEFKRVLKLFFGDVLTQQQDIDFLLKMTQKTVDQMVMYREFCKFLNKRFVRAFRNVNTSIQSINESNNNVKEIEQELKKEASLNYAIRKCSELNIDLRQIFIKNDENELSVMPRMRFYRILESLPLGLLSFEIDEIFENDLHFDNYGNVDYTVIINSDIFVTLERQRLRRINKRIMKKRQEKAGELFEIDNQIQVSNQDMDKLTDNRKVVIEDLIYIDDLEILIYTTVAPKTSTIFITHTKKTERVEVPENQVEFPKAEDPSVPVSHKFQKSSESAYQKHSSREFQANQKTEIIIWNIQRDLVELFQTNPPWNVPVFRRFDAHNASIIEICYLPKAQIIVSASTDQTIRFFDPISKSDELTDPNNIPHAQQKPGYYKPLQKELSKSNATFKEIKRIYTGTFTSCFALRCLNIQNIHLDPNNPDYKSQIEWVVGLKLGKPQTQGRKNTQVGFICGYGIERVKIEIPAIHLDDVVPPFITKECEDLVQVRRKRLVTSFQHSLPHKIEKIYSQVALQNSYIAQVRKLFLQAILQRKDLKYVNPEPLREIYKIILKLPNRTKFQNFLATSGCSDKLSVSETFFYLQKFQQIHPLRTTQIEFEKSIEEFQQKHSREFLRGVKRWPKKSIQKLANYIRMHGLDFAYLQTDSLAQNSSKPNQFCTRDRFIQYFNELVSKQVKFSDEEIDSILNELDPYFTGIIQVFLIQNYFKEEIHFHNLTTLNRPKQIFQDIRSKVFPSKKLAIQQSLTSVDVQGDGYIKKEQFIEAFMKAEIYIDRDILEFLFDVVSEKYNTWQEEGTNTNSDEKVLSITYFINKLFSEIETSELSEVNQILSKIKAALIYKGLDFSIIFAENTVEQVKGRKPLGQNKTVQDESQILQQKIKDTPIDLTINYSRFAQQLVRDEFCQRLVQLHATSVTQDQIKRLANFLCLNQKNNSIIYLNSWLHHLRRVATQFQEPDKKILPVICSKLLRNETVFRSYIDSTAELKHRREEEKIIEVPDLRQVLTKFGVNYINQEIYLTEFTQNEKVHVEDLITKMKNCLQIAYNFVTSTLNKSMDKSKSGGDSFDNQEVESINDLRKTDYFDRVQMKLKNLGSRMNSRELIEKMRKFDNGETGKIKIYHFINVLKHNFGQVFDSETLVGLQFELECMNTDNCVDYEEFVKIFIEKQFQHKDEYISLELKLDKRSTYQIAEYEDLLSRISMLVKEQELDMHRLFQIYVNKQGTVNYQEFKKILDLVGFHTTDSEFRLLVNFADENGEGIINGYELASQIQYAREIAPQFDVSKWIVASRELKSKYQILERVSVQIAILKDALLNEQGGEGGHHTGIITGEQFQNMLRDAQIHLGENDLDLVTTYAIKGSKRAGVGDPSLNVNIKNDLIQFFNFEKSLIPIMNSLRNEDYDRIEKDQSKASLDDSMTKLRKDLDKKQLEQKLKDEIMLKLDPQQKQREQQLTNKILEVFVERDITFFDCFHALYDPLNPNKSIITISQFKKSVNSLNLPLTVQEHRILRRIADPQQIGKVDLHRFCVKFETEELRKKRLNGILEQVATSFYLQNFNLRRAFALFDRDGDGIISNREFRQGWLSLNIGLTYDEIDDLMKIADTDHTGSIKYDEFLSIMDVHIKRKKSQAEEYSKDIIFHKLKNLLDNNKDSLVEIMFNYDIDNSGYINAEDLIRVFKKIGILHPEPQLDMLKAAGGVSLSQDKIDYITFSEKLYKQIQSTLGLNIKKSHELIQKIYAVIQAKKASIFDLFCILDINMSGSVSKLELKTGIQSMGIAVNNKDFDMLWKMIKRPEKQINLRTKETISTQESARSSGRRSKKSDLEEPDEPVLSYLDLLQGFVVAGCLKLQKSVDNTNNLVMKFRQQMKKKGISVEKAYKQYDSDDNKFVVKHDFINECYLMGLEFSEEELEKIFEFISQINTAGTQSTDQQKQQIEKKTVKSTTRFTFKQFHDAILVKRDENWLFNSFLKIHGVVLQKNVSYKRLFTQWREKNSKTQAGRLQQKELKAGLKKLRAGLTQDEIEKLMSNIPFEGKDIAINYQDFERIVREGAQKLQEQKIYQKLIIQEWITAFNDCITKQNIPVERLFQENDREQRGSITFDDFVLMNQFIGVALSKKDLKGAFDIIDQTKHGRIRLEEVKTISSLLSNDQEDEGDDINENEESAKLNEELVELYEQAKEKLEKKNTTLESIVYEQLKYLPNQYANTKGIQQLFEKLQIIVSKNEVQKIMADVSKSFNGRHDCSFKDFIDYMTRKRINVAFLDKGFIDPLIAACCQNITKSAGFFDLTIEKLFTIYDRHKEGKLTKQEFLKAVQGMQIGVQIEDIIEFFNYIDDRNENIITRLQFVDAITYVTNKIGGGSKLEQALSQGVQNTKKGHSLRQQVFGVLQKLAETIQNKRLQMRQVIAIFDIKKDGFLSRAEFSQVIKNLETGISQDQSRLLMNFFDEKNLGSISVIEFVKSLQEIINHQVGGGVYAFMQIQPILQRLINELAVDCDKFFDELADLNDQLVDEQIKLDQCNKSLKQRIKKQTRGQISGLSKRLFYQHLGKYGVQLNEDEKTLLNTVFGMPDELDKFDYEKLDIAFEGVQQQLYTQESFYTVEWERRIFKKIGEYLRRQNITIHKCFNLIDEDNSQTVSIDELRSAIIRFNLDINDKELKVFLQRLDDENKGYISQNQFIKRFWSAYTYENVFENEEDPNHGKQLGSMKHHTAGGLNQQSEKMIRCKMFQAIQRRLKQENSAKDVFAKLDTGIGILSLKNFSYGLSHHYDITLKRDELTKLFREIDQDRDGLVKYKEFEVFYNTDYNKKMIQIEKEKSQANVQVEVFDHLIKVLEQKSLSLAEVFDQIDTNQNGFIECDEFQNLLERLGFTISESQVYELMRQMDENFDGRISYNELKQHIKSLGFNLSKDQQADIVDKQGKVIQNFQWRDKGIEIIIRSLNDHLNKQPFDAFFQKFDSDHDNYLTPSEFRLALLSIKNKQLKNFQIERILHILINDKKHIPVLSINKISKFFKNYTYLDSPQGAGTKGSQGVLIDEDLFVYIVERYDGFSRLVEQIGAFDEKSAYLQRHVFELSLRGLNLMANQKTVEKLHKKSIKLNELFQSTLILLAGEANRMMKEEAQLCVLDPTFNINTIVNDQNTGVLNSIQVPMIENSAVDIDFTTLEYLPSGAQRYTGLMPENRKRVEILIFPNEDLNYVSQDGKAFKKHLSLEQQVHRFLMGAQFEEEGKELDPLKMDVIPNIGKFEKKIGLAASDKEIYVVNELIDQDVWISLDDFVTKNGGILNIPLFYHTDAPLFIVRYWAQKLLQIIHKVHEVSAVLRGLDLKQIMISRDGQRMKLTHLRGVGKVNNLGNIQTCPDIYLTLENNLMEDKYGHSSTMSPGFQAGASSKKTDTQKSFSNRALDSPFIAPEILFSKFSDHTSALDVWSFGMIMYCVLLGQKPDSFYSIYRGWYKRQHGYDIELSQLPFLPPSNSNFLYDPFSVDFDNPFQAEEQELNIGLDIPGSLIEKRGTLNFENCMKCIKNLSNSSLFDGQGGSSKKFHFKSLAQGIKDNQNPNMTKDLPPRFAGQALSGDEIRKKVFQAFAKAEVLERKNELGLILDIVASCLDIDPKKRPTIQGLMHSPLFQLDKYEMTNAIRFSQNVILYRSPQASVCSKITTPLRHICAMAIKNPDFLFEIEPDILKLFALTEECLAHISTLPLDLINDVLTEDEKRKGLIKSSTLESFKGKDFSQLRVSPNSPLAAQIIEDKIIDMLIFITLRYFKGFATWKQKKLKDINKESQGILKQSQTYSQSSKRKSVKFQGDQTTDRVSQFQTLNQQQLLKKQTERIQNNIFAKMCALLKTLLYEMHSYNTPMSPFVKEVLEYIVKFYVGEEYELGSDYVLRKTSGIDSTLKDYLRGRSFFRRENELSEQFKSDTVDKLWHTEQKNKTFLDKSNYWTTELHKEALRLYKDAITESGMGQSCYPVINDYITNINNSFEPTKIFSKQMNQLCLSFLIPMNRTSAYYDELIPLTECLARLYSPDLEKAGKRCALAVIRSVFQTGTSDKIKTCLDMRVPKHIIHFLQDNDSEVRHECLLIFYEISKGLQDDDFEIIGKSAANLKPDYSKRSYNKTSFDQHKSISLMAQQQDVEREDTTAIKESSMSKSKRGKSQQSQADIMSNYIKRTTALIEKSENEKYMNFAIDLPNLNFLSNKRFLSELAICFESPVFIAPLIRLLKSQTESFHNKEIILQILANLFCGNDKVLIAVNSPACDTYMTLLKMLMTNSKLQSSKTSSSGLSAQMRNQLSLQDKTVELFNYMFEQRRPSIIRDLSCIGSSSTILKEQSLTIPNLINLPEIIAFVDEFAAIQKLSASMIVVDDFLRMIQDLRCWIKHFYQESQIPELTRIKALQRCINLIVRVVNIVWNDFGDSPDQRGEYLILIKASFSLIDWLCVRKQERFIFNEQNGKYNLDFIIERCSYSLSAFRHPQNRSRVPMEELAHNTKNNSSVQQTRKYDMFPFTEIGAILQNILYQLVRKNDTFINQLLSEADFGFVFGEHLILEYDFIRHCIDNKIESMVLIDTYVKKNEIRLNTYEYLLKNNEHTLKHQFIKSNFMEKMFAEYIQDFREFNIQFSKIDLEFLAFRKTFPIRLECISILNTTLLEKERAPGVFTELIMYARRHFLIRNEVAMLKQGKLTNQESTSLLLFSIILESNQEDLIYAMMQEGVHKTIKDMMKEYPSLNKRFPILTAFINKF